MEQEVKNFGDLLTNGEFLISCLFFVVGVLLFLWVRHKIEEIPPEEK